MGAYLHLRGLTEDDDTLDRSSNGERFHYLNEPGAGAVEMASTSTAGPVSRTGSREEDNYAVTNEMDECSTFWAGQLDDVFEELHVRAGYPDAPRGSRGLNASEREDGLRIPGEQRLDSKDNEVSSSGKSGSIRYACIENKSSGDVSLVGCGGICNATTIDAGLVGGADKGTPLTSGYILGGMEDLGSTHIGRVFCETLEDETERLPDHLLIELLVRVPTRDWPAAACVKKRWAQLFKGDGLWQSALMKKWPAATSTKRWPGPIARGSSKRRYTALYISDALFAKDKVVGVNEVAGHVYLFLKEQLESSTPPVSYGLLHGTIIDQFLACCKTGDEAHDLASHIWIAVLDNLDETENTFHLLMRIAEEWEIFLPYPYSKSKAVQWRLFERLFTDFRDCLSQYNYFDVLTRARNKFELIPQTWLGY